MHRLYTRLHRVHGTEQKRTYNDVDTFAGARRSDKQTRLLMSDEQTHQSRVSYRVDGLHNDLAVHGVTWYWRHVRQRLGPLQPRSDTVFHHFIVIDESVSWDWRHAGTHWRLRQTRKVQTDSSIFSHSALHKANI